MRFTNLFVSIFVVVLAFVYLIPTPSVFATDYYCRHDANNNNGNGTDPGTAGANRAWRDLDVAATRLTAGDILYVMAGTYDLGNSDEIIPSNSGTLANPICYYAVYKTGMVGSWTPGTVIIDGTNLSAASAGCIEISSKDSLVIG